MVREYKETHQQGYISIENLPDRMNQGFTFNPISIEGDFGIQIAKDGRVWVCINGIAFLRFKPEKQGAVPVEHGRDVTGMCVCGHLAQYHDRDGFCCGDPEVFEAVGPRGKSNCTCREFRRVEQVPKR